MKKAFFAAFIGVLLVAQALPLSASAACVSVSGYLSQGSQGAEVRALQEFLVTRNYPGGGIWMVTGNFGAATAAALRNFQREFGLPATGALDSATRDEVVRTSCGGYAGTSYQGSAYPAYQSQTYQQSYPYMYTGQAYDYGMYDWTGYGYQYPYQDYFQQPYQYPQYPQYPYQDYYQQPYQQPYYPQYPYQQQYPYYNYGYNAPFLDTLSVNTGGPGTLVTISGRNFDLAGNTVYVGSIPVAGVSSNGTTLTFTVPYNAGSGAISIKVTNSRGTSNSLTFNVTSYYQPYGYGCSTYPYNYNAYGYGYPYQQQYQYQNCYPPYDGGYYPYGGTPNITYLNPQYGGVGTWVTVYGSGFTRTNNTVHFGNGVIASISSNDGRAISFQVPASIAGYGAQTIAMTTYDISVTNGEGRTSNTLPFTVTSLGPTAQPTIANVTGPTSLAAGAVGTWTIQANNPGAGYLSVSVDWGDVGYYYAASAPMQTTYLSQQTLTFTHTYFQSGTYTVRFTVTNATGQTNTTSTTVNVTGAMTGSITLASVSPTSGRTGTQVVLTGTGFTQDNAVHFGIGGMQHVPSYNGTTIYYTIPSYVSACDLVTSGYFCGAPVQLVQPGAYQMYVTNGNGTTQQLTFTVTP